ncbi:MAG TPA: cytochrome c oxidase assembly protein [Rhizomicrobium sp.]|jgi:cytochrome c oxidase assembly factor CtaG
MRIGRALALAAALLSLFIALLPPLATMAARLFAAHMAQHLILIAITAPLLALARPHPLLERLFAPLTAWLVFVAVFLFWHWPVAFQWAAGSELTGLLELGSILAAATLFWSVMLAPVPHRQLNHGAAALAVMTAAIATDLPGVVMLFAPRAICTMPGENAGLFGLTPLEDQQLAGLLMWVPANLVFFGLATWQFARWMAADERGPSSHLVIS